MNHPFVSLSFVARSMMIWGPLLSPILCPIVGPIVGMSLAIPQAQAAELLTMNGFLTQVKEQNSGVKGALLSSQASQLRSEEGNLLLAPTVYSNLQYTQDSRISQITLLGYDSLVTKTFSFGVSQLTRFGLQAKLHYDVTSMYYNNPVSLVSIAGLNFAPQSFANASPVLELTQSLWSNSWGASTRANQEHLEAQALSSSYNASYQAKSGLSHAEITYWNLALARQIVSVQSEALDRAKKIYDWSIRRVRLHLADPSDALQAEALMQVRELDLTSAHNQVRSASRDFNSARSIDSDSVEEKLEPISPHQIEDLKIPKRAVLRDDVKAALESEKAALATATISLERDAPTLDVFTTLSLNGQPSSSEGIPRGYIGYQNVSDTVGPSFSFNRPSVTVGLKFSVPLDLSTVSKARDGWRKEKIAAEMLYDRKLFEQEESWKNLNETLSETRDHLRLSRKLEMIQASKLNAERIRLRQGRTTTYQVLLFEQDYLQAQLGRIRDQASVLTLIAQMKLFGETL